MLTLEAHKPGWVALAWTVPSPPAPSL